MSMELGVSPSKIPTKKNKNRSLFSKAKGLVSGNKALEGSDTTDNSDYPWKSDSPKSEGYPETSPTPATPRTPKSSLLDSKRNKKSRTPSSRKASLSRSSTDSGGSFAGQKIRRVNSLGALSGPPLDSGEINSKEMDSVNNSDIAVVTDSPKKKSKRRKSLGALDDAKDKTRKTRSNSNLKGLKSPKKSSKNRNGGGGAPATGVDDLMAHLGPPPDEFATLSPSSGKPRTTVDGNGRIRRVPSKKKMVSADEDDGNNSDGDHSRKSTSSKKSTKSGKSRKGKKPTKDGELRKKKRSGAAPAAHGEEETGRSPRRGVKKEGSKNIDTSGHDDNNVDVMEKPLSEKKLSKRNLLESTGSGSVSSFRSDDSEVVKTKSKRGDAQIDSSSNHSKKRSSNNEDLNEGGSTHSSRSEKSSLLRVNSVDGSMRRGGRKRADSNNSNSKSSNPSRARSVPNMPDAIQAAFSKAPPTLPPPNATIGDDNRSKSPKPSRNKSVPIMSDEKVQAAFTKRPPDVLNVSRRASDDEVKRLNYRISLLQSENDIAQAEVSKLRKELRDVKLESQRSQTERRELRSDLREREFVIKESDMRIEALEKAVETQLDKIEDMEDELRRANEEMFVLEDKLSRMEDELADSGVTVNGVKKERDLTEQRHQRLERRLEEKEKDLVERENALKEERRLLLGDNKSNRTVEQLEQDNRMLLKAMNREKTDAEDKLKEKEAEIEALRTELQRSKINDDAQPLSSGAASTSHGNNEDLITSMEKEIKRLKDALDGQELGDIDKIKRELQAAKNEGQAMKSKYEGAQRRNLILEDEIDHWKSVNCSLEDELAEQKGHVAQWREKYESVVDVVDEDGEGVVRGEAETMHPLDAWAAKNNTSPAHLAIKRDDSSDDQTVNTISNLWSKLTTPAQSKKKLSGGNLPSGSLKEVIARSTFH